MFKNLNYEKIMLDKSHFSINGIELLGHAFFSKANKPLEMHIHENCIEIVIVLRGKQTYFIEDKRYEVTGNRAFICFENTKHSTGENHQGLGEIYWIQLNTKDFSNFLALNPDYAKQLITNLHEIKKTVFVIDEGIKSLIKVVFDEFLADGQSVLAVSGIVHLLNLIVRKANANDKFDNKFISLDSYIDKNIYEKITTEHLAQQVNYSVSTINHKFIEFYGMTPKEYINYKKIEHAKDLLITTDKSVTDIAMELGYNSSDYFSTVFKKFVGVSPVKYVKYSNRGDVHE